MALVPRKRHYVEAAHEAQAILPMSHEHVVNPYTEFMRSARGVELRLEDLQQRVQPAQHQCIKQALKIREVAALWTEPADWAQRTRHDWPIKDVEEFRMVPFLKYLT